MNNKSAINKSLIASVPNCMSQLIFLDCESRAIHPNATTSVHQQCLIENFIDKLHT